MPALKMSALIGLGPVLMAALIGFGSAVLAIVLTPALQHYFWRRQRHAELSLAAIDRCTKLIVALSFQLPEIRRSRKRTEADTDLLRRWDAMGLEIRSLFSMRAQRKFRNLNQLIAEFANPEGTGDFRGLDFEWARIDALVALYEDIGMTGNQVTSLWWQIWRP
jgi:hypothetical protein